MRIRRIPFPFLCPMRRKTNDWDRFAVFQDFSHARANGSGEGR